MSLVTDSFGNQGHYLDKSTGARCSPSPGSGKYDTTNCYFNVDIRAHAASGGAVDFNLPTTGPRTGLPDDRQPMYGGCFQTPTPPRDNKQYESGITTEIDCNKAYGTCVADRNNDGSVDCADLSGLTCEKTYGCHLSGSGWDPDYLRPGVFEDKTLSEVLGDINNGRVGDINIFDNIKVVGRDDVVMKRDNQETSVKGIVDETALSKYFFSKGNTEGLQQTIRFRVYEKTEQVIDYQSPEELYIVMRSVLLQHGNFKVSSKYIQDEILNLNKIVTTYCVNEVSSNVVQYKGYLKDLEQLPVPLDRPSFNESGSRNRSYDMSNHIAPSVDSGWGSRHEVDSR